jgi:hypothetical protein
MTNDFVVKDSGERQQFGTGAQRDSQEDKPRFDLIPSKPLERIAYVYARGARKYDENNWMKGIPVSRTLASAERHLQQYKQGDKDEDHLAQAAWNLFAIMHYEAYPQFYEQLYDTPDFTADTLEEALKICTECGRKTPEHDKGCPYGGWEGDEEDLDLADLDPVDYRDTLIAAQRVDDKAIRFSQLRDKVRREKEAAYVAAHARNAIKTDTQGLSDPLD